MKLFKRVGMASVFVGLLCSALYAQGLLFTTGDVGQGVADVAKQSIVADIPSTVRKMYVDELTVTNNSGGAQEAGIGKKLDTDNWLAGQIDASATPDFIDDTTDAQSSVSDSFAVTTTTNNDGSIYCAKERFSGFGVSVTQGEAGSPVYAYSYYNGSSMASLTALVAPASFTPSGDYLSVWAIPPDWAKGVTTAVDSTGALDDYYCVQFVATTAPSNAVLASLVWLVKFYKIATSLADDAWVSLTRDGEKVIMIDIEGGEVPVCWVDGGNNANMCSATYYGVWRN